MKIDGLWIKHPRNKKPDVMLTVAVVTVAIVLGKFLLNGVSIKLFGTPVSFGTVNAGMIGALLTPTLGAYALRKMSDSPDKKKGK